MNIPANSKIIITGGSGLVGSALSQHLLSLGYDPAILSRSPSRQQKAQEQASSLVGWRPDAKWIAPGVLEDGCTIIHLAGKNIGSCRWTTQNKQAFRDSRIGSADFLFDYCRQHKIQPGAFISASGVGYYPLTEKAGGWQEADAPGQGFMSQLCQDWESAAAQFQQLGARVCQLRTGFVLASKKKNASSFTALDMMALPHRFGVGMNFGNGRQILSWIHLQDLISIYTLLITDPTLCGVFNAVAPAVNQLKDLNQLIATTLHRPFFLPNLPAPVVRLIMGEMSEVILKGSTVSAGKLQQQGFEFQFPNLEKALQHLLS